MSLRQLTFVAAAAMALAAMTATDAEARDREGRSVTRQCYAGTCTWTSGPARHPNIIHVPGPRTADEAAEAQARDDAWVARCNPRPYEDRYGMTRYSYDLPGCEYGGGTR